MRILQMNVSRQLCILGLPGNARGDCRLRRTGLVHSSYRRNEDEPADQSVLASSHGTVRNDGRVVTDSVQ